jgi:hypothetical protein
VSKKVPDGTKWVSFEFCILKHGKCVSKYVSVKKNEEFVCPPAPSAKMHVEIDINCPCGGPVTVDGTLTTSVTSLKSSIRFFKATVTDVTNGKSDTVTLTNGTPGSPSVPFVNGHEYQISWQAFDKAGGKLLKQGVIVDKTISVS